MCECDQCAAVFFTVVYLWLCFLQGVVPQLNGPGPFCPHCNGGRISIIPLNCPLRQVFAINNGFLPLGFFVPHGPPPYGPAWGQAWHGNLSIL